MRSSKRQRAALDALGLGKSLPLRGTPRTDPRAGGQPCQDKNHEDWDGPAPEARRHGPEPQLQGKSDIVRPDATLPVSERA